MKKTFKDEDLKLFSFMIVPAFGFGFCIGLPDQGHEWFLTTNMLTVWMILCTAISGACLGTLIFRWGRRRRTLKEQTIKLKELLFTPDVTNNIVIGDDYTHNKKKYKQVTITNKTKNSIEFKDSKDNISWITFEEFAKTMTLKANNG